MTDSVLTQLVADLLAQRIRIVDLTQTLSPEFPQIVLPPEMGQAWPFRIEETSRYDERGPAWYWNNFSCSEHTGTHFDAPIHWISGMHLPNASTDTIPPAHFIAPACVLDCSREAAADADFLLTIDFLRNWEKQHGRIPPGAWILMRTDWSKRTDPVAYQNLDETGQHTPGPDPAAVRFLVDERRVLGFGSEAIGTDAGQAFHLKPPYPVPLLHARLRPLWSSVPDQSRPAPRNRFGRHRGATQDQAGQRQPVARACPGADAIRCAGPPPQAYRHETGEDREAACREEKAMTVAELPATRPPGQRRLPARKHQDGTIGIWI